MRRDKTGAVRLSPENKACEQASALDAGPNFKLLIHYARRIAKTVYVRRPFTREI